jgi:hypothetical protein
MTKSVFRYPFHDGIVIDNGLDLPSYAATKANLQSGIEVMRMPPREPWRKGSIERLWRPMNTRLVPGFPDSIIDGETTDD